MKRWNVQIVSRNWAQKLAHALVSKSENAAGAVVQQFCYDAFGRLQERLERTNSTVRVPCLVVLTRFRAVAATILRWKDEESRENKESEPTEGRPTETRQGSANMTRR